MMLQSLFLGIHAPGHSSTPESNCFLQSTTSTQRAMKPWENPIHPGPSSQAEIARQCWELLDLALLLECLHQGHGPSQSPSRNNRLGLQYIEFTKYLAKFLFRMSFVTTWLQLSIPTERRYKLRSQTLEMHLFTLQSLISGHQLGLRGSWGQAYINKSSPLFA